MKIALTFLTCGRVDYSRKTIETLLAHNPNLRNDFILLHADDVSPPAEAKANRTLAQEAGFHTVYTPKKQVGVAGMTEMLFHHAEKAGARLVLNLQNDWECMRSIPLGDVYRIFDDPRVYCLRLYGAMKSPTGRCGIHHGGRTPLQVVEWQPYGDGYEAAEIHWGHPPAVTRIEHAVGLTKDAPNEKVSRLRSGKLTELTVRVVSNVFNHIGRERTPRFRA